MNVEIDQGSGYCFGVEFAIQMAEAELHDSGSLFCLGDIVHNDKEVERLENLGLKIIDRDQLEEIRDAKVLIRAHGEPPATYHLAMANNLELIDASCPVVLKLQNRVKNAFDKMEASGGQLVIYGKPGHAEVIGLEGQTHGKAIVVMNEEDLDAVDFSRPVTLFSQTTKSTKGFYHMKALMEQRIHEARGVEAELKLAGETFDANDSICRQVSGREPQLLKFAAQFDVILFVAGKKSSNGKALYGVCQSVNPRSYFLEGPSQLDPAWLEGAQSVGICGATSTPMWLMEQVKTAVQTLPVT